MRSRRAQFSRNALLAFLLLATFGPALPAAGQESDAGAGTPAIVNMQDSEFDPQVVMVEVNQTVSWTNHDTFAHDVTLIGNGTNLSSPRNMGDGATYQFQFTKAGVFDYYCTLHSNGPERATNMWGRVVVVDKPLLALAGEGAEANPEDIGVKWLAHWVGIISFIAVFVVLIIYYFVLKYGETVHATDHRDRKEK